MTNLTTSTIEAPEVIYDKVTKIRDKSIKFRKWKIKDKRKFSENSFTVDEDNEIIDSTSPLVYDCLENPNIILSPEEFRYVFTQIRKESLGNDIEFEFTCASCESKFNKTLKLTEIVKPMGTKYSDIVVKNIKLGIGDIINKEFYESKIGACISESEEYLVDFLLHINSINNKENFTYDELVTYFDNLDVDISEEILEKWEAQKFYIDDTVEIECPECKVKEIYSFDEIPGFIPESWYE